MFVREQFSTSLNLAGSPRIDNTFLGVWGTFSTLEEANAYLNSSNFLQVSRLTPHLRLCTC